MLRNREVTHTILACVALIVVLASAAWLTGNAEAIPWIIGAALVAAIPWIVATRLRYHKIAQMSAQIDAVLHGERAIDLAVMNEGELAVLASELNKMVSRLNLTAEELAREKQMLSDALADISHQIKTPLTSLSITTELVRKSLAARDDRSEDVGRLRRIEQLHTRIENLVAALLKLARIDAGVVRLVRERVNVDDLVHDAVQPLAIAFDIAEVSLDIRLEEGCSFLGDRAWTAEALENVLKNCLEHTPAGGCVAVEAWEDAIACRIRVTDTGAGIAEDDLPHIFERFYRGSEAAELAAVNPAGVGIGLSLAQSLITAQDGTITASNAQDADGSISGARFDIAFFKSNV